MGALAKDKIWGGFKGEEEEVPINSTMVLSTHRGGSMMRTRTSMLVLLEILVRTIREALGDKTVQAEEGEEETLSQEE